MIRLVVLGDPVAHSLSPRLHQAALEALGIAGRYLARRVDPEGMRVAVAEIRRGDLDGASVTMPHKGLAAELVDHCSAEAARAHSVNTIVRDAGALMGHSTDVGGLRAAWGEGGLPETGGVLLLGGGGAAAAALLALEGRQVSVATRRRGAGRALLGRVEVVGEEVPWGEPVEEAVVVNATPLGMAGENLPPGLLEASAGLFDMAYGPRPTPAVLAARHLQRPVVDGLSLLVAQAALSFELWTGRKAPLGAMRRAVETPQGA